MTAVAVAVAVAAAAAGVRQAAVGRNGSARGRPACAPRDRRGLLNLPQERQQLSPLILLSLPRRPRRQRFWRRNKPAAAPFRFRRRLWIA